jgi:hypothetical protein
MRQADFSEPFTTKNKLVTKYSKETPTWTDPLDKQPKRQNMDMRFRTCDVRSLYSVSSLIAVSRN